MAGEQDILDLHHAKIAVEILPQAIPLSVFKHPNGAVYIFGPEDGSVPKYVVEECKEIVSIPSNFCLNLAATASIVLYDRTSKLGLNQ
jgi:tRNA(Leu) C34 or U34 (ribose-2'-O)-methylase TrmL